MKRKHRVVVEITADKPITERRARMMVSELVDQGRERMVSRPTWWRYSLTRVSVLDYGRVIGKIIKETWRAAEENKRSKWPVSLHLN